MSELEKTERATPRRIEKAREEGQVPQSRDLTTFLVLMLGVLALVAVGDWMGVRLSALIRDGLRFDRAQAFDTRLMLDQFGALFTDALILMVPLLVITVLAALLGPALLGGIVLSPKALGFKFSKLNPVAGLKRMFSVHGVVEMLKSALKASLIALVGVLIFMKDIPFFFSLMNRPPEESIAEFFGTLAWESVVVVSSLALLVALDVPFQLWQYYKKLRMTKDEIKREYKETEGDPHVKARVRSAQREMARRRMMAEVPKAAVVVTNPTHFSVALKYDPATMNTPIVVAKGRGDLALKIREIAAAHNVPTLEAPPLARALYTHCELEEAVPTALYIAIAEVMAYIFRLNQWARRGGPKPQQPATLPVPEGLDPGADFQDMDDFKDA